MTPIVIDLGTTNRHRQRMRRRALRIALRAVGCVLYVLLLVWLLVGWHPVVPWSWQQHAQQHTKAVP